MKTDNKSGAGRNSGKAPSNTHKPWVQTPIRETTKDRHGHWGGADTGDLELVRHFTSSFLGGTEITELVWVCVGKDAWDGIVRGRGSETLCYGVQMVLVPLSSARYWSR